jgi:eukaryotic-like serine/threonine-protein kinase
VEATTRTQPASWERFTALTLLGASLSGQKKYEAAEPLLVEGYQGLEIHKDSVSVVDRAHVDRTREWIVELYRAWDKPAKVAEWRKQ